MKVPDLLPLEQWEGSGSVVEGLGIRVEALGFRDLAFYRVKKHILL